VFDEYEFNRGGSTEISKMRTMDKLLFKYKDVVKLSFGTVLPIFFEQWGGALTCAGSRLKTLKFNVVLWMGW
jgi:hypothetical protein